MDYSNKNITGIIPARYGSTRFQGKPLAMIGNKSMIKRVFEQAKKATLLDHVFVATDDKRIENHVKEFGNVIITDDNHQSGTERCGEIAGKLLSTDQFSEDDIIINIQGDEPFINPKQIDSLARLLQNPEVNIATLAKKIKSTDEVFDENCVKVLINKHSNAIYFSRMPLPFVHKTNKNQWIENIDFYRHIGIYGYKTGTLLKLVKLAAANIEIAESLEQLRWLYNGFDIKIGITEHDSYSIDVKEDIDKIPKNLF